LEFLLARKHKLKWPGRFLLSVKPYILLAGLAARKFFRKRSKKAGDYELCNVEYLKHTEFILGTLFKLLMSHEFLNST
jgi:hypothetical protein